MEQNNRSILGEILNRIIVRKKGTGLVLSWGLKVNGDLIVAVVSKVSKFTP